jgi:putative SOS response-associated peptidase YedK
MCGRYTLTIDPSELMERFNLTSADTVTTPRYNIAPTQNVAVIYDASPPTLSAARWGLIPSWSKDASIGARMINARAETLDEKPAFRSLLKKKRCLIPADGFYEWRKNADDTKTPMRIMLKDGAPFALAGLWDVWKTPEGEWIKTCTIITTSPNALMEQIHNRMPVLLTTEAEADWLNKANDDPGYLKSLLQPYAADKMKAYEVSRRVNAPKNDDPQVIDAVA